MDSQERNKVRAELEELRRRQDILLAAVWEAGVKNWDEAVDLLASTLNIVCMQQRFVAFTNLRHIRAWFSEGGKN